MVKTSQAVNGGANERVRERVLVINHGVCVRVIYQFDYGQAAVCIHTHTHSE